MFAAQMTKMLDSESLRRHATELLHAKIVAAKPPPTIEEFLKLTQELEIHQIEMEMMNVELRQSRDDAEMSLE